MCATLASGMSCFGIFVFGLEKEIENRKPSGKTSVRQDTTDERQGKEREGKWEVRQDHIVLTERRI